MYTKWHIIHHLGHQNTALHQHNMGTNILILNVRFFNHILTIITNNKVLEKIQ